MSWTELDEINRKTNSKAAEARHWVDMTSPPYSTSAVLPEIKQDTTMINQTRGAIRGEVEAFRQGGVFRAIQKPSTLQKETLFMKQISDVQRKEEKKLQEKQENTMKLREKTTEKNQSVENKIDATATALRRTFQEKRRHIG